MMLIRDFTAFVDKHKIEYIEKLKKEKKIRDAVKKYVEMNKKEREIYQTGLKQYIATYVPERWKEILTRKLLYRKPCLVNAFDASTMIQPQVFVTAAFVKPGYH